MKIKLALEWFINPDHLPFIVGIDKGLYEKNSIELEIIEPKVITMVLKSWLITIYSLLQMNLCT